MTAIRCPKHLTIPKPSGATSWNSKNTVRSSDQKSKAQGRGLHRPREHRNGKGSAERKAERSYAEFIAQTNADEGVYRCRRDSGREKIYKEVKLNSLDDRGIKKESYDSNSAPPQPKRDAPQATQEDNEGNSSTEQDNAVQSNTEAVTVPDNVNNKSVDNSAKDDIIEKNHETAETEVLKVGKIDIDKYKGIVSGQILSDEVIITDNQIEHIIERRGKQFYDEFKSCFEEIVADPDYIFKDAKENTAFVSKEYNHKGKVVNVVLRLVVEGDNPNYKNSIITAIGENKKRFAQRLRNNTPLYKTSFIIT